ncbi:MAG: mucoidy inhibitor MuiA family protein [Bacteroidales bacterium]
MTGKAKLFQVTGLDCNKVKLILSAASPSESKTAPLFKTWFLDYWQPIYPMNSMAKSNTYAPSVRGNRIDEQQVIIDGVRVRSGSAELQQTYDESNTLIFNHLKMSEPLYFVDENEVSKEYALSLDPNSIKSKESMPSNKAIAIYGQRAADGIIFITTKSMDDYIVQSDNALNNIYNIDLPYTIPGNGKEQVMELQTKEISATYQYYCVPKLDVNTYLIAQIKNWQELALHSGNANITYDGTYLGETFINAGSTDSALTLTLGTDPRISVKREKLKDYSSIKILGNETKVVLCYQITVKNNQNRPIDLLLKDQYPISKKKEITVELLGDTTTPSINDTETGVITWKTSLNAGETKNFKISYSVKYPKDRRINIE